MLVNMSRIIDILQSNRMLTDAMTSHGMLKNILNYLGPSQIKEENEENFS